MTIKNYLDKTKYFRMMFLIIRYIILVIHLLIGSFILGSLIDEIIPLPIIAFHIYWFFILGWIIIFFINLIMRLFEVKKDVCKYLQDELKKIGLLEKPDEITNAYQLEQNLVSYSFDGKPLNFSKELAEEFITNVRNKIYSIKPDNVVNFDKIRKVLPLNFVLITIVIILYALPPYVIKEDIYKILFTRRPETLGLFVYPKNVKVSYGDNCEIKVIIDKNYELYIPILYVKPYKTNKWLKLKLLPVELLSGKKVYKYIIENIETKILYKIQFRGVSTKVYTIEPIVHPSVSELNIIVEPPVYTNTKPIEIQSFNAIKYLRGSKVIFSGRTNKNIRNIFLCFSDGRKTKLTINKTNGFNGKFVANETVELWFDILDNEGLKNIDFIKYKINVTEDKIPEVEIISPEDDIIVSPNSIITLIYSVKDDIGISKVELNCSIENKKFKKQFVIKEYKKNVTESIEEYSFDLTSFNLDYGDVINYFLTVYDNDTVSGPKYSISTKKRIEIFSFEKQHEIIQKQIDNINSKIVDYLAKEIELKERLDKMSTVQIDTTELDKLINSNKFMNELFNQLYNEMNNVLEKMSSDPYTSIDTYMEMKNFQSTLQNVTEQLNPTLINNLKNKDLSLASQNQQHIIDTLERLSSITEQIMKKQNMENVANIAGETQRSAEQLLDELKNSLTNISPEQMTKLQNLLSEIADKMKQIASMLQNQKNDLPDDFINRRDIKNIDIKSKQNAIDQLQSLLSKGDIESAIKLAEHLLKQLNEMTKTINNASSDILSSANSGLKKELDDLVNKLDTIIREEEKIYQQTKDINDYKIDQILKQQEKLLKEITDKVWTIIEKTNNVIGLQELQKINNWVQYLSNAQQVINKFKNILTELNKKKLIQTNLWLKESVSLWGQNNSIVSTLKNPQEFTQLINATIEIYILIKELDELFNKEPKIELDESMNEKNKQTIIKQNKVMNETKDFLQNMKSFGKKSFMILPEDLSNTDSAINDMKNAESSLKENKFQDALQQENSAINKLSNLKNKFSDIQSQLQQMMQGAGKPMGSGVQYKSLPGGRTGILFGRVLLPTIKDYIPPKELREDIIKSLSEKYPQEYNKIIQRYYQELLK